MTPSFLLRRVLILFLFAILTAFLCGPALLRRDEVMGLPGFNDAIRVFGPYHAYYQRTLAGGEWPLWNPHICAGMPAAMLGQTGLFYPLNWLTMSLPPFDAIDIQIALHLFIALSLTFWIARRLGLSRAGALAASAAYSLSGAMVGRIVEGHLTVIQSLAWFPMAWGGLCRLVAGAAPPAEAAKRETHKDWAAAIIGFTAMGLAGAPQIWVFAFIVAGYTVAFHVIFASGEHGRRLALLWRSLARLGVVAGAAIVLCAAEWAPVAAIGGETARAQLPPEYPESILDYPFAQTLTLVFPHFFGDQSRTEYWGPGFYGETAASVGAAAMALALFFSFSFANKALWRVTAAVGALTLALAYGWQLGLYGILKLLPPLRMVNGAARFLFALSWAMSLAAGMGIDGLKRRLDESPRFARAAAARLGVAAIVCAGFSGGLAFFGQGHWGDGPAIASVVRTALTLGALGAIIHLLASRGAPATLVAFVAAAIVLLDIAVVESRHFATGPAFPNGRLPQAVRDILARDKTGGRILVLPDEFSNQALFDGYDDLNGYGVTMPADFVRCAAWITGREPKATHKAVFNRPTPAFRCWFAVNYLFLYARDGGDATAWEKVWADEKYALWKAKQPRSRASVYRRFRPVTHAQAARLINPPAFEFTDELLVEDLPPDFALPASPLRVPRSAFEESAITRAANRREFAVSLDAPGWLLMRETYASGWRLRVDGRPAPLYRAQYCLCATPLSAGAHRVEMVYRPVSFAVGLCLSAIGCLAAALAPFVWRLRPR